MRAFSPYISPSKISRASAPEGMRVRYTKALPIRSDLDRCVNLEGRRSIVLGNPSPHFSPCHLCSFHRNRRQFSDAISGPAIVRTGSQFRLAAKDPFLCAAQLDQRSEWPYLFERAVPSFLPDKSFRRPMGEYELGPRYVARSRQLEAPPHRYS